MGNVPSVKLKEDIAHLEINEKLVHDFQYYIKLVDHSMAAFARTTNSLRESFATVKQHVNDGNGDSSSNDAHGSEETGHAPKYMGILETIDDALSDQSFIVMDSLTRLLNFIIDTGNRCNTIIPDDALLFINKYKSKSETFADALDKEMQYHDAVIESLQKKLKRVNEEQRMAKQQIDSMTERETTYLGEKQRLNNKIHELETNSSNLKVKLENIRKDKNMLETKNEKLDRKVNDLIRRNEDAERDINIGQSNFELLSNTLQSEKDECLRKVNASRNEKEELQKILNDKQNEIDSLKLELKNERQNVASLKEQNEIKIKSLEKEKQKLDDDNAHLMSLHEQINKVLIEHHNEDKNEMITHETKTKRLFLDEISKVNAKIDESSKNMISFSETVTRMTNEVKDVHMTENKRLSNCLVLSKIEEENYVRAIAQMREKILQFEEEGKSFEKINDLEKENTEMLEKLGYFEILQKSLEEKSDRFRSEIKMVEETNKTARNEILLLQKQVKEKDKKIQSLEKDMINLTNGKEKMTPYSDEKHMERQMLQEETKEKDDMTNVFVEYARPITDLNESKIQMQKNREEKEKEIRSSKKKTKVIDENEEAIKHFEIKQRLTEKRNVYVKVVHHSRFKAFETEKELQMKLKLKFNPENIELNFENIEHDFFLMSDLPVFVVCPWQFASIQDRDIHAIVQLYKESKMNKMTALVFFHDKDKKSFKKEGGEKGSHNEKTFCDVFDIIYDRDGISECDENSTNIEKMFEFITNACRL